MGMSHMISCLYFFLNDTSTPEIYTYGPTLSLHVARPIWPVVVMACAVPRVGRGGEGRPLAGAGERGQRESRARVYVGASLRSGGGNARGWGGRLLRRRPLLRRRRRSGRCGDQPAADSGRAEVKARTRSRPARFAA